MGTFQDGLKELSSDIVREVLRQQPQHINGFVADYLETLLQVRERTRAAGAIVNDVYEEGFFYGELFRLKKVNRTEANFHATLIQAAWRGYVVRKKLKDWLSKKKKFAEEKEQKMQLRIEELLLDLGITYEEGQRAAGVIQAAYTESKRGKWMSGELGEFWVDETVPFGERLREGDRALGRYHRWEKEDFGDFFEMNEVGAIRYVWPRVGQMRKVLRDEIPPNIPTVEFFAMRDLQGREQYSYLIRTPLESELRGHPIGFLIPKLKSQREDSDYPEVVFTAPHNEMKMGLYTYIFRDDVKREELPELEETLKNQINTITNLLEMAGEIDDDTLWVAPRVLVRIKKSLLLDTDDEVRFSSLQENVTCEQEEYTFRAETLEQTFKVIRHILRNECATVQAGLVEAANMKPYKIQETGRIFPVEKFKQPSYIQKIQITPESATAEEESIDLMLYNYIFLTSEHRGSRPFPKGEPLFPISIIRFQGYHSDYKGSAGVENKVFIMGPRVATPDGKPFTPESLFWDEFGEEAWFQLLYSGDLEEDQGTRVSAAMRDDLSQLAKKQYRQSGVTTTSAGSEVGGSSKYRTTITSTQQSEENLDEEEDEEEEEEEGEEETGQAGAEGDAEEKREKQFGPEEETRPEKGDKQDETEERNFEETELRIKETPRSVEERGKTKSAMEIKKSAVDIKKSAVDIKKSAVDIKKSAVDIKKSAIDVKKSAIDVKKSAIDVKKSAIDVKKSAIDVKKNAIDVKKSAVDVKKSAMDVKKSAMEVRKSAGDEE